jgi:hypothetical protein
MQENRERWMRLCEQAANEQNPEKLMELVKEITKLLDDKARRLGENRRCRRSDSLPEAD